MINLSKTMTALEYFCFTCLFLSGLHTATSFDCTNSSATVQLLTYHEGDTLEFSFASLHALFNLLLSRVSEDSKTTPILSVNSDKNPHFYENVSKTYQSRINVNKTEEGKSVTIQIIKVTFSDAGLYSLLVNDVHDRDPLCYRVDVQAADLNKTRTCEQQYLNKVDNPTSGSGWMVAAIILIVVNVATWVGVIIWFMRQKKWKRRREDV